MIESVILIEGRNITHEALKISLISAKQIVVGDAAELGVILHVAANSPADLANALLDFARVPDVTGVTTLALRLQE